MHSRISEANIHLGVLGVLQLCGMECLVDKRPVMAERLCCCCEQAYASIHSKIFGVVGWQGITSLSIHELDQANL